MRGDAYERLQEQSRREYGNRPDSRDADDRGEENRPQNFGSARSDYGNRGYGGGRNERDEERGWFDRATDQVSSWFGGDDDRDERRDARRREDGNDFDRDNRHSRQIVQNQKGVAPRYPATSPIYEREDRRDNFSSRDYRRNENRSFNEANQTRPYNESNQANQNRNLNQPRGFISSGNQNNQQQPQIQQRQNRWRDWHDTRAGDLMTRNVATVQPNDTVQRAARLMRDEDCGALPVIDRQGRMIGMITDRDITVRIVADGADPRYAQVQDCMTDEVFACHADDAIEGCIRTMKQHQVRRIPIVNDRNQLLGIISQGDLARHADMNKQQGERHAVTEMIAGVSEPSNTAYR